MKIRKYGALLLVGATVVVALMVMPIQVFAAPLTDVPIDVTAGIDDGDLATLGWEWNDATKVLTFQDFNFKGAPDSTYSDPIVFLPPGSTIVLQGTNSIEAVSDSAIEVFMLNNIDLGGLTFKGPGSLSIHCDTLSSDKISYSRIISKAYPLYTPELVVQDGADISATGNFAFFIYEYSGGIHIENSSLKVDNSSTEDGGMLSYGDVTVDPGGILDVTGMLYGLNVKYPSIWDSPNQFEAVDTLGEIDPGYYNVTVDGGILRAKSKDSRHVSSAAIRLEDTSLYVRNGGTLEAIGANFGLYSQPLFTTDAQPWVGGAIEISDSTAIFNSTTGKPGLCMVFGGVGNITPPTTSPLALNGVAYVEAFPIQALSSPPANFTIQEIVSFFIYSVTSLGEPFDAAVDESAMTFYDFENVSSLVIIKPQTEILSYNSNGGSDVASANIALGEPLQNFLSPAPTKADHIFEGWYLDEELTIPASPSVFYTQGMNLYACWSDAIPINSDGYLPAAGDDTFLAFMSLFGLVIAGIGFMVAVKIS